MPLKQIAHLDPLTDLKKIGRAANPRSAQFLLPDGSYLQTSASTHEKAALQVGWGLTQILAAGIARYLPGVGVEIDQPLTRAQATRLANDWQAYYASYDLMIDVTDDGDREIFKAGRFTADTLYHWCQTHIREDAAFLSFRDYCCLLEAFNMALSRR